MEAATASEATTIAVRGNMLIDTRVIKVASFKSEVKLSTEVYRAIALLFLVQTCM